MNRNANGLTGAMNSITSSFGVLKGVLLFTITAALVCCSLCVMYTFMKVSEMQSKVYILDRGATFSASMQDAAITREDEIRDHVTRFHTLFFNIPPNMEMIRVNLDEAFKLADRSAYDYYQNLTENGFYTKMTAASAYQQIVVEDIEIDLSVYPYKVVVRCSQFITRQSNMTKFSLVTECVVADVPRSGDNLHGLMIQKFRVTDNRQIETRNR